MKNNAHVPKETVSHDKTRHEWVDVDESNDDSEDSHDDEGKEIKANRDGNDSGDEVKKINHKKKKKDNVQFPFQMIESISQQ